MKSVLVIATLCFTGCALLHRTPKAAVQIPGGSQVNLTGAAAEPAHVSETTTATSLPVPAQSTVTATPADGMVKVQVSAPTQLTTTTRNTQIDGPKAAASPTPIENAEANSFKWFILASLICGIAAAIAAYTQHYLAAIKFAAAAVAFPVLFKVFSSSIALYVGGGLAIAGLVFVIAWYIIAPKKTVPAAPAIPQPANPPKI
jgi:hypothetical protein